MQSTPISFIFAAELEKRLRWFGRLRWIAVAALMTLAALSFRVGGPRATLCLASIATIVAGYNAAFFLRLRRPVPSPDRYKTFVNFTIHQIVADLAALLATVHCTGGWQSPALPFVVFHMAIGTIMLSTTIMYGVAALTCSGAAILFILESTDVLPALPPVHPFGWSDAWLVSILTLTVLAFGVVYLTHTVTSRFKRRNVELHETTTILAERTEDLEKLLLEKETLQREKSHYLQISAHQLRSPLGTIKTTLRVLTEKIVDPSSEEGAALLGGAIQRVDDLIEIVNDLLELAKMREGKTKAPWTRNVSLSQILADIFDTTDTFAAERNVELVPDFINADPVTLAFAVPPDLVNAFENLIHNAIKYSKNEGGRVVVSHQLDDDDVVITVEDNGIGVPPELYREIFLEFVRAPNAKHHAKEGTGLGLAIVREAAHMHGGEAHCEDGTGGGTRFIVRLPLNFVPES